MRIAQFGGDPDNFQFPRWCLDMSVLRAYDSNGKPAVTPHFMKIDFQGPAENDPVFVSGHPGSTDRLLTVAAAARHCAMKTCRKRCCVARSCAAGTSSSARFSPQNERIIQAPISSLENGLKVQRKQLDALLVDAMLDAQGAGRSGHPAEGEGRSLRWRASLGDPWADIERAEAAATRHQPAVHVSGRRRGLQQQSSIGAARTLLRGSVELPKKSDDRLREYRDTALPRIEQQLSANSPIYPELEELTLSFSLERMREWLGPDDPTVRQLARQGVAGSARASCWSRARSSPIRRCAVALWKGGAAAVNASDDPMIAIAKAVDERARSLRKDYEDNIEAIVRVGEEKVAKARFAALGTSVYPDATFTLRLSYGSVQGWTENGKKIEPFTPLSRLFERATGAEPFAVPASWMKAKDKLDLTTKFNLSTNNDIVGGNSGSPLINAKGDIVGLLFDGNIHSDIGGVLVRRSAESDGGGSSGHHAREALDKVYGAKALLAELQPPQTWRRD